MKVNIRSVVCLWLAMLMLVSTAWAAMPAGGQTVRTDLDGDGAQESLHFYKINSTSDYGSPSYQIRMSLYDAAETLLDDVLLVEYERANEEYLAIQTEIFALPNGRIHMEHRICYEGVSTLYKLWEYRNGGLDQLIAIEDPGYSSATGLRDPETGRDIFYSEDYDDYSGMIAALNKNFSAGGLSFGCKDVSFAMPEGYTRMERSGRFFDNIIIDCSVQRTDPFLGAVLQKADVIVLPMIPKPAAVHWYRSVQGMLEDAGALEKCIPVANIVQPFHAVGEVENQLRIEFAAELPFMRDAQLLTDSGGFLPESEAPNAIRWRKQFKALYEQIQDYRFGGDEA